VGEGVIASRVISRFKISAGWLYLSSNVVQMYGHLCDRVLIVAAEVVKISFSYMMRTYSTTSKLNPS